VAVKDLIRTKYLTHFSKPIGDRELYQAISREKCLKILLFGLGTGDRALRMVEMAQLAAPTKPICFTGIDLFEGRTESDKPGISLMAAHQKLRATGATVRLIPGDAKNALEQQANHLGQFDMVAISAEQGRDWPERASFFLPRVVADHGIVIQEQPNQVGETWWYQLTGEECRVLDQKAGVRRAA
jgi:hypothetical protein